MSTRASLLSASVGVLLLASAPSPTADVAGEEATARAGSAFGSSTCTAQADSASEAAPSARLRAAYAPTYAPDASATVSTSAPPHRSAGTSQSARPSPPDRFSVPLAPPVDLEEPTLWLARAIYSETKLPHEQELVAWVIRNRVETAYRGNRTYREVVLDPYQFSAFNPGSPKRSLLMRLGPATPLPEWQQALWVARYVRHAAPVYRPFSIETRHFYSERSMKGRSVPYWADGSGIVPPDRRRYTVDERRFRFFEQVS